MMEFTLDFALLIVKEIFSHSRKGASTLR